ncbi:MAG TPA: hypothetical protein VFZ43_05935 [Anaerolineales bacterium]
MGWIKLSNMLLERPRQSARLLFIIIAIPGILIFLDFLRSPSEIGNQFLFGLSRVRFAIGMLFAFFLTLNLSVIILMSLKPGALQVLIENRLNLWITNHPILVIGALSFTALATFILVLGIIPPVIRAFNFLESVGTRAGGLIFWLFFASSLSTIFLRITCRDLFRENTVVAIVDRFLLLATIFLIAFFLYEHLLIWTGAANQSRYSYWNLLADEFLRGNLYLENPPHNHDLTLYRGKWYVPMPPLPAILMMPLAYLIGGESINMSDISILFSAINAVLVFLILEQLSRRRWIKLSRTDLLLLVVLFAFGNPHLWVGIRGRAWFVSQIVTVAFLALAVLAALRSWSPWWVGISIGLAIAARPNGILTWPFVFAITIQILKEEHGSISWKQIRDWSIKTIIPMAIAVAGLLIYNYARFENFLDFGYTTIHGGPAIVANAQSYGIFSPRYILNNIKAMFFYLPAIRFGDQWPILPSTLGTSIFLVTPPLIYLFRRYEHKWWILGAWASVFLNFVLLVLYHNTGAHQFGYRYILDALVPLMALLAVALGGKIPWHFILLLLFSIMFNIYGTYWFING